MRYFAMEAVSLVYTFAREGSSSTMWNGSDLDPKKSDRTTSLLVPMLHHSTTTVCPPRSDWEKEKTFADFFIINI